ncbi:Yip1 family protein [Ferrimonas lipolytica]|uniref:YIP1 family protein n=1 Tax=Ferrimonas lipolytica TaxID=2724191 RepID=A0A6H1UK58_9GAMM|nr:Yip1 family protein [Ferrimonas lipolytica]QIZ78703.1 YIP1 family protein [Ferrimonas lipolytica]
MVDHTAISDSNTSENSEPQQPTNPPYRTFPRQPWLAMMLEPRITLRAILASENPRRGFWLLLSLIAISSIIGNAANGDMAGLSGPELFGAMFGVLLLIPLLYVLMYLSAWVLRLVGRWLGGDGELTNIVTGMVWSQVPTVFTLLLCLGWSYCIIQTPLPRLV